MGTPQYMSPEQARGQRVDERTDIFSLGATLYEMITGRKPFEGETVSDVIAAILMTEPAPLSQIQPEAPAELQLIVSKALAKEREARYQSVKDFEVDLNRLRYETGLPSGQDDFKRPAVSKAAEASAGNLIANLRWNKRGAAVALVALLAIALTAVYLVRERFKPLQETAPGRITLAALPFQTLNAPEELRFLGVGIPDSIITRLSNIKQMRVRPISAVLRYENQNINSQEVGRSLACDYLLSGVLQKAGPQFRVSAQLIQVKDGFAIWGAHYDVARQDLISLEDTIAEKVSSALRIRLTEEERSWVYRRYTGNAAAYELYLKGRWRLSRPGREERLAAVTTFENALQFEPQYALAYAGLAAACGSLRHGLSPESEVKTWEERAKQAASRALELDPNLAEAHEALAAVYRFTEFEWDRTIEEASKAIELNPNLEWPRYYRARAFFHLGLLEQTDQEARAGLEINPESRSESLVLRYLAAFHSGQFAQAVVLAEEYLRVNQNRPDAARLFEAFYYHGMRDRAEELLKQDHSGGPRQELWRQAVLASYLAARGERPQAEAILRKITPASETFHHASYSIGAAYAQLGAKAKARLWLARAFETGFPCYPWYERDPLLQPLRGDAEFQRFMADLKKLWEAAKKRYGSEQK
jgi:TolB-like protein